MYESHFLSELSFPASDCFYFFLSGGGGGGEGLPRVREVIITSVLDEDPPCVSSRGVIQDTTYLMKNMDKIC